MELAKTGMDGRNGYGMGRATKIGCRVGAALCGAGGLLLLSAGMAQAAVITVDLANERVPGTVHGCTLREAVQAVNTQQAINGCPAPNGDNVIRLVGVVYTVRTSSISDTLELTRAVRIQGMGFAKTEIRDDRTSVGVPLFAVSADTVFIEGVSIADINNEAIRVNAGGFLILNHSKISRSGASDSGGCLRNRGTLYMENVELDACRGWTAGAIENSGTLLMNRSAVLRSEGARSGAVNNWGTARITSSTFARNTASNWGIITNGSGGSVDLQFVTVAYNTGSSTTGRALHNASGSFVVGRSVITDNIGVAGSPHCSTGISSAGHNYLGASQPCVPTAPPLASDFSGGAPQLLSTGSDAALPAADRNMPLPRGGAARVYLPSATSNLLNRVPAASCDFSDQRGMSRSHEPNCDVGAAERSTVLLVANSTSLGTGDLALKALLEELGTSVVARADVSVAPANYDAYSVVVISDSGSDANLAAKYRAAPRGVVVNKTSHYDNMELTAANAFGTLSSAHAVIVHDVEWKFGLRSGKTDFAFTSAGSTGWGAPAGLGAITQATYVSDPARAAIFTFWYGDTLDGGFSAPAPRVAFPATVNAFTSSNIGAEGKRLFWESVLYASN